MVRHCVAAGPDRDHSVWRYTDQIYKIVQFYKIRLHLGPGPKGSQKHYEKKLDSSLSRSRRVILEKALCNPWEYFCTFTIAESKHDRKNLIHWRDSFTQWMRDQRKKGFNIQYLLVPERHKDGSWHAHGLFMGLPASQMISFRDMDKSGYRSAEGRRLPVKLRKSDFLNWPAYQEKFGFCSFGPLRNPVAAGFYVTKYVTKENGDMVQQVGLHSYYCSKGLLGATKHIDFYGRDPLIDSLLTNKYDFCATGMTQLSDCLDWTFCFEFMDFSLLEPLNLETYDQSVKTEPELEADSYFDFEQLVLSL